MTMPPQESAALSEASQRFLKAAAPAFTRLLRDLRVVSARRLLDAVAFIIGLFVQQVIVELQRRAQVNAALHLPSLIGFFARCLALTFNEQAAPIVHLPALMSAMPDRLAGPLKVAAINQLRVFMVASAYHHRHLMTPSSDTMPTGISHRDAQAVACLLLLIPAAAASVDLLGPALSQAPAPPTDRPASEEQRTDLINLALLTHAEPMMRYIGAATAQAVTGNDILIASAGEGPHIKATLITPDEDTTPTSWDDPPNPAYGTPSPDIHPLPATPIPLGIITSPNGKIRD